MKVGRVLAVAWLCICCSTGAAGPNEKKEKREALWAAVRNGDAAAAKSLIDSGTDVNAKNEIGVTALWIASSKADKPMIEALIAKGADVNARDGIWYITPLSNAVSEGKKDIVALLLKAGAKDVEPTLLTAAAAGRQEIVKMLLARGNIAAEILSAALVVTAKSNTDMREELKKAGAVSLPAISEKDRAAWAGLAGKYESDNGGLLTVEILDSAPVIRRAGATLVLSPNGPDGFSIVSGEGASCSFQRRGANGSRVTVKRFTSEINYYRQADKPVAKPMGPVADDNAGPVSGLANWPSLRGANASGVADGQHLPTSWDIEKGTNVRWKTAIPGFGHSCPIVWGDFVFLTTAISGEANPKVKIGNYGAVDSVDDKSKHTWQVLCLDRKTGKILWTRTAFEGVPKIKRHLKGSQANCTPATDGRHVVACFGSEGLYCYDFSGKLLWKRDLSSIDSSFRIETEYQWGFGSSPIIHDGLAILQCDLSKDSFIAAYRLEDGSRAWSTPRDEIPSWSTPTVWRNARRVEIVTNAAQYARGYDPATGEELWRLAKKSEVTVPTPVVGPNLAYITSGNRPIQPIFGLRPGASGDISLKDKETHNDAIAWSKMRGGPYMPTPILYGPHFYTCGNAGMVTCYDADTGKEIYKERLGGVSYTASPVAADGRIYFVSEEGQVRIIKAGATFELLAVNEVGDICLASPAIAGGALFVRSQHSLTAFGRPD